MSLCAGTFYLLMKKPLRRREMVKKAETRFRLILALHTDCPSLHFTSSVHRHTDTPPPPSPRRRRDVTRRNSLFVRRETLFFTRSFPPSFRSPEPHVIRVLVYAGVRMQLRPMAPTTPALRHDSDKRRSRRSSRLIDFPVTRTDKLKGHFHS